MRTLNILITTGFRLFVTYQHTLTLTLHHPGSRHWTYIALIGHGSPGAKKSPILIQKHVVILGRDLSGITAFSEWFVDVSSRQPPDNLFERKSSEKMFFFLQTSSINQIDLFVKAKAKTRYWLTTVQVVFFSFLPQDRTCFVLHTSHPRLSWLLPCPSNGCLYVSQANCIYIHA
jgi:hypothetical protein